jgi:RNA polymerase sigma factor (TIGR02999 family)
MSSTSSPEYSADTPTDWLIRASSGSAEAVERMLPLVYDELCRLAHNFLQREPTGHTLATKDLVHEAYLRLIDQTRVEWTSRAHFLAIAGIAMRRILIDHARNHMTLKRGGSLPRVSFDSVDIPVEQRAEILVALDEALERLKTHDPRRARVVECRFFGGMTEEETAEVLGIGLRSAKRDWARARSWLYAEIYAPV